MQKTNWILLLFLVGLCSCIKKDYYEETFKPTDYKVSGKVEKGPFISGSTITLQPLDSKLNVIGTSYPATIGNNDGSFTFSSQKFTTPYALLSANGYFFNEVEGELSEGQIALQAIVDLSSSATVNVNILTHLKAERLRKLISDGSTYADADKQVQKELLANFGLQGYADTDVSRFSITSGTNEAAALIVVSSALLYDRSEAELTEVLSKLGREFTSGGKFSDASKNDYWDNVTQLDLSAVSSNIIERYKKLGKDVKVKDLSYFIDWNKDGIAGNELGDPNTGIQIAFEKTELSIPKEGGTFKVKINANVPYLFEPPFTTGLHPSIPDETSYQLFRKDSISYKKVVEGDELVLTVAPSSFMMHDEVIHLYALNGKEYSSLTLKQKGDANKIEDAVTHDGSNVLIRFYSNMSHALNYLYTMEALYTKSYPVAPSNFSDFFNPPIVSGNETLNNSWRRGYEVITSIKFWMNYYNNPMLNAYFTVMESSLYYEMAVLWGNIPYSKRDGSIMLPQLNEKELFALFEKPLKSGIELFDDKKSEFDTGIHTFIASKDVARALLAKMYLYLGRYEEAYKLLNDIVKGRKYELESTRVQAMGNGSREMIYGLFLSKDKYNNPFAEMEKEYHFLSVATYTEVLLSLSECAQHLGLTDSYLKQVVNKRGLPANTTLQQAWASELKGTGSYFAFLKRNNLATSLLGLKDYQLLLPIPRDEIATNTAASQNPGYDNVPAVVSK